VKGSRVSHQGVQSVSCARVSRAQTLTWFMGEDDEDVDNNVNAHTEETEDADAEWPDYQPVVQPKNTKG
jgi:hypothetical protein